MEPISPKLGRHYDPSQTLKGYLYLLVGAVFTQLK